MYFAHEEVEVKGGVLTSIGNALQHPATAIPVVTIIAITLMIGSYWLLKRYTSWNFPSLTERKK